MAEKSNQKKQKKEKLEEQPTAAPRRVKVLSISPEIMEDWLKQGHQIAYEVVEDGLPEDCHLEGVRYDPFRGRVDFLYSSEEFEEVEDGGIPPYITPAIKNLVPALGNIAKT